MTEYEQVMRKIRAVQVDGKGEMGFRLEERPAPQPAKVTPAKLTANDKRAPAPPPTKRRVPVSK